VVNSKCISSGRAVITKQEPSLNTSNAFARISPELIPAGSFCWIQLLLGHGKTDRGISSWGRRPVITHSLNPGKEESEVLRFRSYSNGDGGLVDSISLPTSPPSLALSHLASHLDTTTGVNPSVQPVLAPSSSARPVSRPAYKFSGLPTESSVVSGCRWSSLHSPLSRQFCF
jgi:hypothetical protein